MSHIARGLSKAETALLASLPDLPAAALAILAGAETKPETAPKVIGPERGRWFDLSDRAFARLQNSGADYRWGRGLYVARVPAAWVLYRDRTGKVRTGNREVLVPPAWAFDRGKYPAGLVILRPADRAWPSSRSSPWPPSGRLSWPSSWRGASCSSPACPADPRTRPPARPGGRSEGPHAFPRHAPGATHRRPPCPTPCP